jgi:hypothetical protein
MRTVGADRQCRLDDAGGSHIIKGGIMEFAEFKNGPARSVFAGLGQVWPVLLERSDSFEHLRSAVVDQNDRDVGRFARAVRRYAKTCSTGEYRLLVAIRALVDFADLADDLAGARAWQDITRGCDARFRAAIAACVMEAP